VAKRGRRPFKVTATMRGKVERFLACGMTREQIALAIGCSPPTLDKHFAAELQTGFARRKAEAYELLWCQARQGNSSALRKLLDTITIAEARAAVASGDEKPSEAAAKRPLRLGKKAAQRLAATTAGEGSEWGDDLAPPEGTALN
jgi:AraC-like DNA-binding protein